MSWRAQLRFYLHSGAQNSERDRFWGRRQRAANGWTELASALQVWCAGKKQQITWPLSLNGVTIELLQDLTEEREQEGAEEEGEEEEEEEEEGGGGNGERKANKRYLAPFKSGSPCSEPRGHSRRS